MSRTNMTAEVDEHQARLVAEASGVCVRPLIRAVTDRETGDSATVALACGSTRESVCRPCAEKARRLRMHQCREGWHLTQDPESTSAREADPAEEDDQGTEGSESARRVRSTRRLDEFPDLPTVPMDKRTIGQAFVDPQSGREYRPSMFLTLTLPSYGRVDPRTGAPIDPRRYDYRQAAMDALLFPRLVDRFWQNLRRCAGFKVQYFSAVEMQRRLAAHLHAAVRGAIPRQVIKAVAAATYHAAWWPSIDKAVYPSARPDLLPVFDERAGGYIDPSTRRRLPTWRDATEDLDAPAHVVSFGRQIDIKGLIAGSSDADRSVRYLCKYLTKSLASTYSTDECQPGAGNARYEQHIDRLHHETRWLPCGSRCANWLRFGVEPLDPTPGLVPGACSSPAHDRENLGLGGRRVLVSRSWTGKTLDRHRADRRAVVNAVLEAAGIEPEDLDRLSTGQTLDDGSPRYRWDDIDRRTLDYVTVIAASIRQAQRWRVQYDAAKSSTPNLGTGPPEARSAIKHRSPGGNHETHALPSHGSRPVPRHQQGEDLSTHQRR